VVAPATFYRQIGARKRSHLEADRKQTADEALSLFVQAAEIEDGTDALVHQLTKGLPKNPKLAAVLAEFEREETEEVIEDGEFEVIPPTAVAGEPTAAAAPTPAPTDPATEAQTNRLRQLVGDMRINQATRDRVTRRLDTRGIAYALANTWIEAIELELRAKTNDDDSDELPLKVSA